MFAKLFFSALTLSCLSSFAFSQRVGYAGQGRIISGKDACETSLKLVASDGQPSDRFGWSTELEGTTLAVGAHSNGPAGAVYVFERSGTIWSEQAKLVPNSGTFNDEFGFSLSLSGNTLAVGAPLANPGGQNNAGRAYVFVRTGTTWAEQARLQRANPFAKDEFGRQVAIYGDTLVVGAPKYDRSSPLITEAGAAFVYVRSGSTWTLQQRLQERRAQAFFSNRFGFSVAIHEDSILVGARGAGRAFLFERTGTNWDPTRTFSSGFSYGHSVALTDTTALLGAPGFGTGGKVDVFVLDAGVWSVQESLTQKAQEFGDRFGHSVDIDGDLAVVGSPNDDILRRVDVGSAHVFTRTGSTWSQLPRLVSGDAGSRERFGAGVSVSGDTVVVGTPLDDASASDFGAAYVFDAVTTSCTVNRTAGPNPVSYTAPAATPGAVWTAYLAPATSGHTHSLVVAYTEPALRPLRSGQMLLVGGRRVFQSPLLAGSEWALAVPNDAALVGRTLHTQAVHLFGAPGFTLSNSIELRIGTLLE